LEGAVKQKVLLSAAAAMVLLAGQAFAQESPNARLGSIMDSVFGAGNWRLTGGYRTPERENVLRAQGALTVPPGALSRHSVGRPGAPGAYDVVVPGLSPGAAAARLQRAGAPFRKYFPEGAHGTQGAHLHIEPHSTSLGPAGDSPPRMQSVYFVTDPTPAERAVAALHAEAVKDQATAQLRLGEAYAQGRGGPRNLVAAYVWTARAATNLAAGPATKDEAARTLIALTGRMKAGEVASARRFARPGTDGDPQARCGPQGPRSGMILLVSGRRLETSGACDGPGAVAGAGAPAEGR
jgi:hypothetical protein